MIPDAIIGSYPMVAFGIGWMAEEFEILGEDFHTRGARTASGVGPGVHHR